MTRKINNPLLIQIERHARRAENRQMIRELVRGLLCILVALLLVWGFFRVFSPGEITTGTIIEDSRGLSYGSSITRQLSRNNEREVGNGIYVITVENRSIRQF